MKWPEKPTCHAGIHRIELAGEGWKQGMLRHPSGPQPEGDPPNAPEPFQRCGYCGSIRPEDLLRLLAEGATLHGADWKYGWPHKFYVDMPNPSPETLVYTGSRWEGGKQTEVRFDPVGPTLRAKFYNEHLLDEGYDPEALEALTRALQEHGGIAFELAEGRLRYAAPCYGYQR